MKNTITVTRKTTESSIRVTIRKGKLDSDYRTKICTPYPFLNHMIEHIAWRAALNIEIDAKLDQFKLVHLVTEDVSMTLGCAVREYIRENIPEGYGTGIGIIDEAQAVAAVSFEERAHLDFTSDVSYDEFVEGIPAEELITFLEGFAQGARCTLHMDIKKGENGHHIWEAVYRAFGIALGQALSVNPERKGLTSGVAGKVTYEISSD